MCQILEKITIRWNHFPEGLPAKLHHSIFRYAKAQSTINATKVWINIGNKAFTSELELIK